MPPRKRGPTSTKRKLRHDQNGTTAKNSLGGYELEEQVSLHWPSGKTLAARLPKRGEGKRRQGIAANLYKERGNMVPQNRMREVRTACRGRRKGQAAAGVTLTQAESRSGNFSGNFIQKNQRGWSRGNSWGATSIGRGPTLHGST